MPDRKTSDDATEKLRGDLLRVRSERSQAQQESAQLQLQLQELADKANSKLYDYRLKLKGAKKRSQLRCVRARRAQPHRGCLSGCVCTLVVVKRDLVVQGPAHDEPR